jgi:hypothetical protein
MAIPALKFNLITMPESRMLTFAVSESGKDDFKNAVTILTNTEISPDFKITSQGNGSLRIVFPVFNDKLSDPNTEAFIMDEATWNNIGVRPREIGSMRLEIKSSLLGVIEISNIAMNEKVDIVFSLDNFATLATEGNATCFLQFQEEVTEPDGNKVMEWLKDEHTNIQLIKTIEQSPPVVTIFQADNYFLPWGEHVTLKWELNNAAYCKISGAAGPLIENSSDRLNSNQIIVRTPPVKTNTFVLTPYNSRNEPGSSKSIDVEVFNATGVRMRLGIENKTILSIYEYNHTAYALVLDKVLKGISLFSSYNGISDWLPVYNYSLQITFDLYFAGTPGVIFQNKLWLIGGSSFNVELPGNQIGYYDFATMKWKVVPEIEQSQRFTPRMGHACIVIGKQIWVIGGYHPDSGTYSDIWTSIDGINWKKSDISLPNGGRCMMGVALYKKDGNTGDYLWIYGGFKEEPGVDIFWQPADTYILDQNTWKPVPGFESFKNLAGDYKACALVAVKKNLFLLSTTYYDSWKDYIILFSFANFWEMYEKNSFVYWGTLNSGFSLTPTVFKGSVLITTLSPTGPNYWEVEESERLCYMVT